VLTLLARGLSNAAIAASLHLGEATVRTHVGHLFAKIGARDRAQAVVFAYESGVVRAGDPTPLTGDLRRPLRQRQHDYRISNHSLRAAFLHATS